MLDHAHSPSSSRKRQRPVSPQQQAMAATTTNTTATTTAEGAAASGGGGVIITKSDLAVRAVREVVAEARQTAPFIVSLLSEFEKELSEPRASPFRSDREWFWHMELTFMLLNLRSCTYIQLAESCMRPDTYDAHETSRNDTSKIFACDHVATSPTTTTTPPHSRRVADREGMFQRMSLLDRLVSALRALGEARLACSATDDSNNARRRRSEIERPRAVRLAERYRLNDKVSCSAVLCFYHLSLSVCVFVCLSR
jgi:hypothetical protein